MKKIILLGLCGLCISGSAFAAEIVDNAEISAMAEARFKVLDTNKDGKISKDEYLAAAEKKFADNDSDHDGYLSQQDLLAIKLKEAKELSKK